MLLWLQTSEIRDWRWKVTEEFHQDDEKPHFYYSVSKVTGKDDELIDTQVATYSSEQIRIMAERALSMQQEQTADVMFDEQNKKLPAWLRNLLIEHEIEEFES